ncbi:hypothetical protein DTO045G8_3213 [Paecilomyces variotii]|nr:hypothetical protein DTO045G8_3213 [Paecilomyces variotii]
MNPSQSGFGFVLIAKDSCAVLTLRKRDGGPEPFVFVDCPTDTLDDPQDKVHTVRVVCLSDNIHFRVMERGVQGTIMEIPDICARNRFVRAVSLEVSRDQHVPEDKMGKRTATSRVYDFFI